MNKSEWNELVKNIDVKLEKVNDKPVRYKAEFNDNLRAYVTEGLTDSRFDLNIKNLTILQLKIILELFKFMALVGNELFEEMIQSGFVRLTARQNP